MKDFFAKAGQFLTNAWNLWSVKVPSNVKYIVAGVLLLGGVIIFIKWCL